MTASQPTNRAEQADALFRAERRRLWGLAYRLTGSAEDADDVVQEAFVRLVAAAARGAARGARPLARAGRHEPRHRRAAAPAAPRVRRALAAVAGRDARGGGRHGGAERGADPEARYGLAESATYAFLLALEALGPRQRAVLLLRDVLGHSARETAELLGTSEGSVRVLHLRARRALEQYDRRAASRRRSCASATAPRSSGSSTACSPRTRAASRRSSPSRSAR